MLNYSLIKLNSTFNNQHILAVLLLFLFSTPFRHFFPIFRSCPIDANRCAFSSRTNLEARHLCTRLSLARCARIIRILPLLPIPSRMSLSIPLPVPQTPIWGAPFCSEILMLQIRGRMLSTFFQRPRLIPIKPYPMPTRLLDPTL